MSIGQVGFIALGRETTWGTPVSATDYIEALSESLPLTIERYEYKNITNQYTESDDAAGLRRIAGTITLPGYPEALRPFLRGIFGEATVTEILSGFLYTNTFKTPSADWASGQPVAPYTVEVFRDVTSSHRYGGAVFTTLELNAAPNQDLRATVGLLAKTTSIVAKSSPSFVTSPLEPFTFDTCSVSIGGAGSALIEALTISVDGQVEGIPALNATNEIAKIRRSGPQMVNISGTIDFNDLTEYNNFVSQAEQAFVFNFTKASSFSCRIDLPRVVYTAFPMGMPGKERLTVAFEGKARYKTTSATAIQIDVTTTSSGG